MTVSKSIPEYQLLARNPLKLPGGFRVRPLGPAYGRLWVERRMAASWIHSPVIGPSFEQLIPTELRISFDAMGQTSQVTLRPARVADAPMLASWDRQPHVIACSSDNPDADVAFGGIEWTEEIEDSVGDSYYMIAEVAGVPVGVMQVCDPHTEQTHYWGEIEPGLRAIDIWIGPPEWLGRGVGTQMMTQIIDHCFAAPDVTGIVIDPLNSNTRARRFYRRLGFTIVGRRMFDEDDCLVMRLEKADWLARARA